MCLNHGLLEEIFSIISNIQRQEGGNEKLTEFFLLIKFILKLYDGFELNNSDGIMDLMLQKNFLYDSYCSDLCMTCIAHLLRFQNDSNYCKFGKLLKEANITIKIKLLNSIQEILKVSATKKLCQESFLRAEIFATLNEIIITPYPADDELITL